jgi:hypothetical protein
MPVGGRVDSADDLEFEAFDASFVLGQMEASRAAVNVVILDACRNMPLVRKHRGVRLGLRRMDGPRGSVIAYATSPGGVASDGEGRNGVYTKHLLQALRHKPHLPVTEMLIDVTASVMKETADRQVPWQSVSLTRRFCFSACAAQADPAPPPEVPAGPPPPASRSLVANVEASSTLPAQSDARGRLYTYEPHRALDGDARTAWVEGGDGHGVAQWLRVDFAREVTVSALDIIGRYKSDQNSRLARLEVELSDGSSREFVLEDSGEVQTLTLEARQRTRWVKLRILAVHPGTKWEDTPIAEVDFR